MTAVDQGFVLNEDAALKSHISSANIAVTDSNDPNGRPVPVYFRLPQDEERRARFPYITIDLVGVTKADDREHRGHTKLPYFPQWDTRALDPNALPANADDNTDLSLDYPIPYNLDYEVISWSRFNQHSRDILAQMMAVVPNRFGSVTVPQDGTIRSLDVLNGPTPADLVDDNGKRLFRNAWVLRVYAELLQDQVHQAVQARQIYVTLNEQFSVFSTTSTPESKPAFNGAALGA